ncbi:class I SAM-dependent RNA methyltransferase [Arsenicitalea aurantiaca]|uniref:Class I SAM-dependent RNA methyltransferase n=1 Tax=Arsenicitalea aurantiaca TaxID=1783274 RepID=A0A433X7G1_9HYPH|nr:class I SAM-dependent RNA methyltransferase [Arsenicitalea aurantiaca]RUT30031.1 class I SAM-dependent RNA methyltransferase [Arsenicitalea aurantiaca]
MIRAEIVALGRRGEGVAEIDGSRVYVPFALPGEQVAIERAGERGRLVEVLSPSPDRVVPFCPYFGTCGGCSLQHLAPDNTAGFKRDLVATALARAGVDAEVADTLVVHGKGRRRVTLHARGGAVGYMRVRSHELVDIAACPVLVPGLRTRAPAIARACAAAFGDCDVSLTSAANGIDVAVETVSRTTRRANIAFDPRLRVTRITLNGEMLLQWTQPEIRIGEASVPLPPASFLQATEAGEDALGRTALTALSGCSEVADLFCGLGPFALRLAPSMRVTALDADRAAIDALEMAVRNRSGLKPVTIGRRDLFSEPLTLHELVRFDGIVIDPPRAGAQAQMEELARSQVSTIVSVACDPGTFARDAAILVAGGYRLGTITPIDQFAFSHHVEMVGVFRK